MIYQEIAGLAFNKAEHNRTLRTKVDRSGPSIEFKHRNISAVLERLGLPMIRGYLPAANHQGAIVPAIDRYISQHPEAMHPEKALAGFTERLGLFVAPPPLLLPIAPQPRELERLVRKFNPIERDFRNRKLGRDGEELVFQFEQEKLRQIDRVDLANKVRWISEDDGDGAGFDILSFDETGKERLLEVKTTVGSEITPFYLTRNELCLSSERPDAFRLCRVFEFSKQPRMFELSPPLEKLVHLSPLSYEASFS
jgi:hypothetical protein